MKAENIKPGMVLALKPNRQADLGNETPFVTVLRIQAHKGYSVPWIVEVREWTEADGKPHSEAFYKPSDFQGSLP